ncbi:hypothetical protein DV735_g599, partial [Chaetothyriales sp. CBS 134920]
MKQEPQTNSSPCEAIKEEPPGESKRPFSKLSSDDQQELKNEVPMKDEEIDKKFKDEECKDEKFKDEEFKDEKLKDEKLKDEEFKDEKFHSVSQKMGKGQGKGEEMELREFMFRVWYHQAEKVQKLVEEEGWVDEKYMWRADIDPEDFLTLESHERELLGAGSERGQDIYLMAKAAQKYSGTKEPLALVLRICCILTVNCLTLTDAVLEPVGIALDPVAALVNHSCDPNCVIRFDSGAPSSDAGSRSSPILGSISIDVLRPIRPGEELTISYIDNTQPRDPLGQLARSHTFPFHRFPGAQLRVQLVLALIAAGQWRDATLQSAILVYRIDPVIYPEPHHPDQLARDWNMLIDQVLEAERNGGGLA